MNKTITVLVTAYNEEKNIVNTLDKIFICIDGRKNLDVDVEVMVIDDGSDDNTLNILKKFSQKRKITLIVNPKNIGMGASVKKGIALCKSDKLAMVPGDNDLSEQLIQYSIDCAFQADVVSFYLVNDEFRGNVRYFISKFHNLLYCFIFNQYLIYFNGPKVYPVKHLQELRLKSKKFALVPEKSIKIMRMGVTFTEIPGERINDDSESLSLSFWSLVEAFYVFIFTILDIYIFDRKKFSKKAHRIITKFKIVND